MAYGFKVLSFTNAWCWLDFLIVDVDPPHSCRPHHTSSERRSLTTLPFAGLIIQPGGQLAGLLGAGTSNPTDCGAYAP